LHWRRVQHLYRDYAAVRVDLNDFESEIFVPEIRARLAYLGDRLKEIKQVCESPGTLEFLRPALANIVPKVPGSKQDSAAEEYLAGTAKVVEDWFLSPLRDIEVKYAVVKDVPGLLLFLNEANRICLAITASENLLFRYRMVVRLYAKDKQSGQVIVDEPKEFEIVLTPFRAALDDLKRVSEATEGTMRHWKEQLDSSKKPFLEYLTATTNAATSRRNIVVQVLAIFMALAFSTFFLSARDPFALKKEATALRADLLDTTTKLGRVATERDALQKDLVEARVQLERRVGENKALQDALRQVAPPAKP
jgi:hypothetical protein